MPHWGWGHTEIFTDDSHPQSVSPTLLLCAMMLEMGRASVELGERSSVSFDEQRMLSNLGSGETLISWSTDVDIGQPTA